MSKTLSIIVPIYGSAKYLHKCLSSLTKQNLKTLKPEDIEIICVDDCSPDKSAAIVKEWQKKSSQIKLVGTDKNSGLSAVRNLGLQHAKGEFIMFCDGDDYYEPTMCEKMYRTIVDERVDLVTCRINLVYKSNQDARQADESYYSLKYFGRKFIHPEMIEFIDASVADKIFRRSIIDKYSITCPEHLHFEDAFFTPAYIMVSTSIYFLDEPLYNYVRHEDSCMTSLWNTNDTSKDYASDHLDIAFRLWHFMEKHKIIARNNEIFWRLYSIYMPSAITKSKTASKRTHTRQRSKRFVNTHAKYFEQSDPYSRSKINFFHKLRVRSGHIAFLRISQHIPHPLRRAQDWSFSCAKEIGVQNDKIRAYIEKNT